MNWYKKSIYSIKSKDGKEYFLSDWPEQKSKTKDIPIEGKWKPVESSFISAVAYFEPLAILEIKDKNGKEYRYNGVEKKIFDRFMRAKSKGTFFNKFIRPKY